MNLGQLIQIIIIGMQVLFAFNFFYIYPIIDRRTEYMVKHHTYTMGKRLMIFVSLMGVFSFLFIPYIKRIRKLIYFEKKLEYLNEYNWNDTKNKEIQELERILKLHKLKNKSKKFIFNLNILKPI